MALRSSGRSSTVVGVLVAQHRVHLGQRDVALKVGERARPQVDDEGGAPARTR